MKPVYETVVEDRSYDVTRDVVETSTREEQYTVMKPVYETVMQQQVSTVRRPVYETSEREQSYTVAEPVTQMRTAYSVGTQAVDTVTPVVTPGTTSLGWVPATWVVDPATGLAVLQRGGYAWTMTPGSVVNQVNRAYQPTYTPVQVPETTYVNRVVTQKVPVQTVRYLDEQVVQQVPVQTMKMVAETAVRQVPVQTVRKVVERVENKVPVQVCRMVPEEQIRQVPVQVCKFVTEERVEPVQVQVMKYVTEERIVQVPRVVEKKTPYSYTQRTPRVVVTKVPLDDCGNPLPVVPAAAPALSAAASRPAVPPTQAPAMNQQAAAQAGPVKTYSDRPTETPATASEGWGASELPHVDPQQGTSVRADRPAAEATGSESAEQIPSPAASQEPTIAPLGPAVEPAPPVHDQRDVPAANTSGRPLLQPLHAGHTT